MCSLQKSSLTLQSKRPLSSITEKCKVTLRCPNCGHRTIIPIGGVSRVPKNYLLERQLNDAIAKLQAQQLSTQGCSQCNDQNEVNFKELFDLKQLCLFNWLNSILFFPNSFHSLPKGKCILCQL